MDVTQVQIGGATYPLAEGQQIAVAAGDVIKVYYSFRYKLPAAGDVEVWASFYKYTVGILNRVERAQAKQVITLGKALDWKDYSGEMDIIVGDISSGTYGLICELPDYDVDARIENCFSVAGVMGIVDMIPMLIMVMMMGMMMNMIGET